LRRICHSWPDPHNRSFSDMGLLLGILLAAVSVAAVAATLWLLPNDGYGQRVFGTDDLRGRSVNSPYLGRELPGEVRATFFRGRQTVADGVVVDEVAP
jgi:dihydroorotase